MLRAIGATGSLGATHERRASERAAIDTPVALRVSVAGLVPVHDERASSLGSFVRKLAIAASKDLVSRLRSLSENWGLFIAVVVGLGGSAVLSWRNSLPPWSPLGVALLFALWTLLLAARGLWQAELERASTAESELQRLTARQLLTEQRTVREGGETSLRIVVTNRGADRLENLAARITRIHRRTHQAEDWTEVRVDAADHFVWDGPGLEASLHAGSEIDLLVATARSTTDRAPGIVWLSRTGPNPYPEELPEIMGGGLRQSNGWCKLTDRDLAYGVWRFRVALEADGFRTQVVDFAFALSPAAQPVQDDEVAWNNLEWCSADGAV